MPEVDRGTEPDGTQRKIIHICVQPDTTGFSAHYAAALVRAWETSHSCCVWLSHLGDAGHFSANTRSIAFSLVALRKSLAQVAAPILVLCGRRVALQGLAATRGLDRVQTIYIELSDAIYEDASIFRVARNYREYRTLFRASHRIVFPTEGLHYQFLLREWASEEKYALLPLPPPRPISDTTENEQVAMSPQDKPPQPVSAIYVGPLEERAQLTHLLHAWAVVEKKGLKAHLTLLGDGSLRNQIALHIRQLGLRHCSMDVATSDAAPRIERSHLIISTALYVVDQRPLLHALSSGAYIVAMDADGIRELITDDGHGILTASGDVHAFSEALIEAILSQSKLTAREHRMPQSTIYTEEERFVRDAQRLLQGQDVRGTR